MTCNNKMVVGLSREVEKNMPFEFSHRSVFYGHEVREKKREARQNVVKHNRKLAKLAKKARKAQRKATMGMRK